MSEDTKVQDNNVEGKPESDLHAEQKPVEEAQLPEGTKERTAEQFEKLKESNKKLQEELESARNPKSTESILDSLKPKAPAFDFPGIPENLTKAEKKKLIDESGYLNSDVLEQTLSNAERRANEAEKAARETREQLVKFEETQQTRMLHEKYPELDPHGKSFDETYFNLVRNELFGQMVRGEKDALKAAANVKKYYTPKVAEEKKAVVKEDQTDQKQQINAGQTKSGQVSTYQELEDSELIMATRKNKKGALAERLKRAGY